jgi:hypothetical protein
VSYHEKALAWIERLSKDDISPDLRLLSLETLLKSLAEKMDERE